MRLPAHGPGGASPRSWSLGLNTEYSGYGMYFSMPNVCVTSVVRLKKCWPKTTETLSLGGLCSRGLVAARPLTLRPARPSSNTVQGPRPQTLGRPEQGCSGL